MVQITELEIRELIQSLIIVLKSVILLDVKGDVSVPFSSLGYFITPIFPIDPSCLRITAFLKNLKDGKRKIDQVDKTSSDESPTAEAGSGEGNSKRLNSLEHEELISFDDPQIKKAVKRLQNCLEDKNLESWFKVCQRKDLSEKDLVVAIGVHLVKKLTDGAFSREDVATTKCPCGCDEKVDVSDMCIGLADTWHGELDLLSGNKTTNISIKTRETKDTEDPEGTDSDNSTDSFSSTNLEAKKDLSKSATKLCRMFGESIVFSFTEYNRNPEFGPLVPTIQISNEGFTVCIYDSTQDEMYLPTGYVRLPQKDDPDNKRGFVGILVLWLCLNHHLFFRQKLQNRLYSRAGFIGSLCPISLEKYRSLNQFSKSVKTSRDEDLNYVCLEFLNGIVDCSSLSEYNTTTQQ